MLCSRTSGGLSFLNCLYEDCFLSIKSWGGMVEFLVEEEGRWILICVQVSWTNACVWEVFADFHAIADATHM